MEDWREEGYLYEEMVETFKWLNEVASDMNVQLVQSVGDIIVDSGKTVVCKHTDETFSVKRTVLIKSPENCAGGVPPPPKSGFSLGTITAAGSAPGTADYVESISIKCFE